MKLLNSKYKYVIFGIGESLLLVFTMFSLINNSLVPFRSIGMFGTEICLFILFAILLSRNSLIEELKTYRTWKTVVIGLMSVLLSLWLVVSFIVNYHNPRVFIIALLFFLVAAVTVAKVIINLMSFITSSIQKHDIDDIDSKKSIWTFRIISSLGYILSSYIFSLAYYPGILTNDSANQWQQAHTSLFNNWHPVIDTLILKMTTSVLNSPMSLVIFQTVIYICSMIWVLDWFMRNEKGNILWVYIVMIFTWVFPLFGLMNVFVVKDTLFTIMLFDLSFILYRIYISSGEYLRKKSNILLLLVVLFLTISLRNNGIEVIAFVFVFVIIFFRKKAFWKLSVSILLTMGLSLIVTGPIYKHFNVIPASSSETFGVPTQILAGVYNSKDNSLTKDEKKVMYNILPAKEWKHNYNPYTVDDIKFKSGSNYNRAYINAHLGKLVIFTGKVALQNPSAALRAYIKATLYLWRTNNKLIMGFPDRTKVSYGPIFFTDKETAKEHGMTEKKFKKWSISYSQYHKRNKVALKFVNFMKSIFMKKYIRTFLYPAVITILCIILMVSIGLTPIWKANILFIPLVANELTLMIGIPAQQYRYFYALYLVILLGVLVISSRVRPSMETKTLR